MKSRKSALIIVLTLLAAVAVLLAGVVRTNVYNSREHVELFSGPGLFHPEEAEPMEVSVEAVPRSSTWTKVFDLNGEGTDEPDHQAYTYDFTVTNNTRDQVAEFSFKLTFDETVYIASAWNGALEIHQNVKGGELVATVPDMRVFEHENYSLETVNVGGEYFIVMRPGDYLRYFPSSAMNAQEMPIEPLGGTTPGIILYVAIGDDIEGSEIELDYRFHRVLTSEPLFWVAMAALAFWLVGLIIFAITSVQIRRYQKRHERDNEIINESIETFTGFIDAKDPYTNGHSKRVAIYTRQIAKEFGYTGEDLDHIYYVALLHDCGKIGVPDNILGKPGRLTPEEFEVIKSHTVRGGEILSRFTSLEDANEGALYHHERYDGNGYPEGRAGEDIPFIARMICVADSYDAMNTDRVYRKKLPMEKIVSEIETNKGLQFDPRVAEVALRLLRENRMKGDGKD